MKVVTMLSLSRSSSLAATVGTFDLSKPLVHNKRQSSFRKNYTSLASGLANEENESIKNEQNETDRLVNAHSKPTRKCSILLKLSSEHLILIRVILFLKYHAAKQNFKSAYKPYDLKDDLIEQYTRGNLDILVKIKELQRRFEHFAFNTIQSQKLDPVVLKLNKIEKQYTEFSSKLDYLLERFTYTQNHNDHVELLEENANI